jgi:hypothetical protein
MICLAWFGVKGMRVGARILGKVKLVLTENEAWKIFVTLQTGQFAEPTFNPCLGYFINILKNK